MTVVTETPNLGSVDPEYVAVEIFLAGEGGVRYTGPAVQISTGDTVMAAQEMELDEDDGHWTATLVPNSDISPAGTKWARRLRGYGISPSPIFFDVPNVGGTVSLPDIIEGAPGAIPSDELAAHEAKIGVVGGHLPDGLVDKNILEWDADTSSWQVVGPGGEGGEGGTEEGLFAFKQEYPVGLVHVVDHDLGYEPAGVYITDSGGNEQIPESIVHNSINRLTVTFRFAFGTTIRLS